MQVLSLDEDELTSIMIMSSVKRLLSKGHSANDDGNVLGDRVNSLVDEKIDSIRKRCAEDLFLLRSNGAPTDALRTSAMATFALAGVEIADQIHRELASLN